MKDKSLLNIAGIIAIVMGGIYCFMIITIFVGIPLIIGGIKFIEYSKLSDSEILSKKDNILIWSIVFCFISLIPGILGIIYYFGMSNISFDFKNKNEYTKSSDKYEALEKLNNLYRNKGITKEEYEKEKERILNN